MEDALDDVRYQDAQVAGIAEDRVIKARNVARCEHAGITRLQPCVNDNSVIDPDTAAFKKGAARFDTGRGDHDIAPDQLSVRGLDTCDKQRRRFSD